MAAPNSPAAFQLLTRHFLRRFLDNDLISPDADRHETLTLLVTALLVPTLFFTMLQSIKYLTGYRTPGINLLESLDDKFVYVSVSMLIMGLAAVMTWDALSLEDRDASILGTLPVSHRTIAGAKLAAVAIFASGLAVAVNLIPTAIYPSLVAVRFPFSTEGFVRLTSGHAFATMAAGAFAFLTVLAMRESLRAAVGLAVFRRLTGLLRGMLLVVLTTAFLLLPWLSRNVNVQWVANDTWNRVLPPLWFIGVYERWTSGVLLDAPAGDYPVRLEAAEGRALSLYTGYEGYFADMATMAFGALATVLVVALAAYVWNARTLPVPAPARRLHRRGLSRAAALLMQQTVVRTPLARAGFFFALATLARSTRHRMAMATWASVGFASTALLLREEDFGAPIDPDRVPMAWVAVQTVMVAALVAGIRHAVRVPAELQANWTFKMCWSGDQREYLRGSMRAALLLVVAPLLVALVPLHVWLGGWSFAVMRLLWGAATASAMLAVLLIGFDKLPFAGSYWQKTSFKSLAPFYIFGFWTGTQILASMEHAALRDASAAAWFAGVLVLGLTVAHALGRSSARRTALVTVDELPDTPTQRLGLHS